MLELEAEVEVVEERRSRTYLSGAFMIVSRHGTRRDDVGARRRRAERGGRRSGKEGRSDRGGGVEVAATSISKSRYGSSEVKSRGWSRLTFL